MTVRFLVINADDFGYSNERNRGIIDCFRKSCITSTSLLVNGVKCDEAAKLAIRYKLPTGLHVNLTEGTPVGGTYKTLTADNGYFRGKFGLRKAAEDGILSTDEIRSEIQAQIDKYRQLMSDTPFHADGHQHIHTIPGICEIFASVLEDNGVRVSRLPIETGLEKHSWAVDWFPQFMNTVVEQSKKAQQIFTKHNVWAPNKFLGLRLMGADMTLDSVKSQIADLYEQEVGQQEVMCEWMVHPGYMTQGNGGCGDGIDGFSRSPDREHEMKILCDDELLNYYKSLNITLTDFKRLYSYKESVK